MSDESSTSLDARTPHDVREPRRASGRWRFSLKALMLFTLFAAMALALGVTGLRLRRAESELDQYRSEYGILQVDDPMQLCAIARWTPEPRCWRWRVHFPPGKYRICNATAGLLSSGVPKSHGSFLEIGYDNSEMIDVSTAVYWDAKAGEWKCAVSAGGTRLFVSVPPSLAEAPGSTTEGVLWGNGPADAGDDGCLVLLRHRVMTKDETGAMNIPLTEPSNGLLIWIVPEKAP